MKTCLRPAGTWHALRSTFVAAVLVAVTGYVAAQSEVSLNPAHPDSYVVQRGDTLWDISKMFLNDPWYWPEIWYVNPQVENPHLIYPGDVLSLVYVDGKPRVQLSRGSGAVTGPSGTERLSPSIRYEDIDQAITAVALEDIRPFLAGGMIMDKDEIEDLPHIVALRERMIAGAGHEIYVSDIPDDQPLGGAYLVLRIGDELRDPETNKMLGYEVIFLGRAELRAQGNPAEDEADTLFLTDTDREAIRGDRVKVADLELPLNFFPSAPTETIDGQIISVVDGVSRIGQYQMVILNRGTKHGLSEGNVLSVWQQGETVTDEYDNFRRRGYSSGSSSDYKLIGDKVKLPDRFAGNLMVVKAYNEISYALVMEAESEMRVLDRIANP